MSKRGPKLYLKDIRDSIERIEEYTRGLRFEEFANDLKTIDAVVRNLTVIGEAARNVPAETKSQHNQIPWDEIAGMRNKVIHEYFSVDETILWKTIQEDLPIFKTQILELLKDF